MNVFDGEARARILFWFVVVVPVVLLAFGGSRPFFFASAFAIVLQWFYAKATPGSLGGTWARMRWLLKRSLTGSADFTIYSVAAFIALPLALFAWFASGVEGHDHFLSLGALLYAFAVLLAYNEILAVFSTRLKPRRKVLIGPLSAPIRRADSRTLKVNDYKYLLQHYNTRESVLSALRNNALALSDGAKIEKPNIFPLLAVLAHPDFKSLERMDILIAKDTLADGDELGRAYLGLFESFARLLKPNLEIHKRTFDAPAYDVKQLRLEAYRYYDDMLRERSQDLVFNITSATAAFSAALALVAVRGAAEGVYIDQNKNNPLDGLVTYSLNIYDIEDIFDSSIE